MPKINKDGSLSEQSIHLAVLDWVRLYPNISKYIIHIPNESKRTPSYGKTLKKMGMRKGVADLLVAMPRKNYCGAWIEIKSDTGKISTEQKQFLKEMEEENYFCSVTYGIDDTMKAIKWYCEIE